MVRWHGITRGRTRILAVPFDLGSAGQLISSAALLLAHCLLNKDELLEGVGSIHLICQERDHAMLH
jgi:hypothetical protein